MNARIDHASRGPRWLTTRNIVIVYAVLEAVLIAAALLYREAR